MVYNLSILLKNNMEAFTKSIEIWNVLLSDYSADVTACRTLLAGEELDRAAKFVNPADADSFILGRGLLRRILADCLGADPAELQFTRNRQGKPFLKDGGLEFNVSHSRHRMLIAVTAGRAVGVDIEFRRDGLNMEAIARRWFSPEEQAFFAGRTSAFFEIWAKKEAYVKALGAGIYKDLNTFSVPLGETPFSPVSGSGGTWFFQTLEIDSGYAAAVVTEAPTVPVNLRSF